MPEKLSPQTVSARLTKAGFVRSAKSRSRIRGMSERSEGFAASSRADGSVEVAHLMSSFYRGERSGRVREMLTRYGEVLTAAGLVAEVSDDRALDPALIVTKKEAS